LFFIFGFYQQHQQCIDFIVSSFFTTLSLFSCQRITALPHITTGKINTISVIIEDPVVEWWKWEIASETKFAAPVGLPQEPLLASINIL
jgi:hypothetical protein